MMRPLHAEQWLKRLLPFVVAVGMAGCASTNATPTASAAKKSGYLTGADGVVVRSADGRCVRTSYWEPTDAIRECEPDMFKRADAAEAEGQARKRAAAEAAAAQQRAQADAEAAERAKAQAAAAAAAAAAAKKESVWHTVGADVYFPSSKATLQESAKNSLDAVVDRAQKAEQARIKIVGYADSTGDPGHNLDLAQKRADSVRQYFVDQGIPSTSIATESRGQTDPVLDCGGKRGEARRNCLQVNRRSEIELSLLEPITQSRR